MEWAMDVYASDIKTYLVGQDLQDLPASVADFNTFFEARRRRMLNRLRDLLAVVDEDIDE